MDNGRCRQGLLLNYRDLPQRLVDDILPLHFHQSIDSAWKKEIDALVSTTMVRDLVCSGAGAQ